MSLSSLLINLFPPQNYTDTKILNGIVYNVRHFFSDKCFLSFYSSKNPEKMYSTVINIENNNNYKMFLEQQIRILKRFLISYACVLMMWPKVWRKKLNINIYIYIYIYIFTFTLSRRFYPKRLTLHSSYSFYILSALAFPGNRTHDLGVASAMLYQLSYRKACVYIYIYTHTL